MNSGETMATRQKADPDGTIEYLVIQDRGEFVIELPVTWKLTFGAVNPGAPPHGRDLHCLRIWEGEKLRAVFCDVRGFRDLSLPLARKVTKETGSAEWTMDSSGNFDRKSSRRVETFLEGPTASDRDSMQSDEDRRTDMAF
jgi:hypothetical protein